MAIGGCVFLISFIFYMYKVTTKFWWRNSTDFMKICWLFELQHNVVRKLCGFFRKIVWFLPIYFEMTITVTVREIFCHVLYVSQTYFSRLFLFWILTVGIHWTLLLMLPVKKANRKTMVLKDKRTPDEINSVNSSNSKIIFKPRPVTTHHRVRIPNIAAWTKFSASCKSLTVRGARSQTSTLGLY